MRPLSIVLEGFFNNTGIKPKTVGDFLLTAYKDYLGDGDPEYANYNPKGQQLVDDFLDYCLDDDFSIDRIIDGMSIDAFLLSHLNDHIDIRVKHRRNDYFYEFDVKHGRSIETFHYSCNYQLNI